MSTHTHGPEGPEADPLSAAAEPATSGAFAPPVAPAPVSIPKTLLWWGHGLLRIVVFGHLLVYGWFKLTLLQMGPLDYSAALYAFGEKSPMGLLWAFVAYAPVFQFLSGLVEVLAGVLLIWRRTSWLGGLLGTFAMGAVLLLNLLYDVPVKQLALFLLIACALILLPDLPRLYAFVLGRATPPASIPRPVPWPRVHAVTRWIVSSLAVLIALIPFFPLREMIPRHEETPLSGVHRVVEDTAEPAALLVEDERWQKVAFGQYVLREESRSMTLRLANGVLYEGRYRHVGDDEIEVSLDAALEGDRPLNQEAEETFVLTWTVLDDGRIHLVGEEVDLVIESDPELRYLYDRGFSWAPGPPVNR
ncbi:hypothetical protein ACIQFP_06750 [Nocardiopsis alba]|uniref:hypothetical protein n=1 Tax=Nocardiopsis alba TaxID=53437 RepID=UPI003807F9DB